jgi:hypothetical protein
VASIANLFDRISNPWIKWAVVLVFGVAMIVASLAMAQVAWGIFHWMTCLGKETPMCGGLYPLPPQPVL